MIEYIKGRAPGNWWPCAGSNGRESATLYCYKCGKPGGVLETAISLNGVIDDATCPHCGFREGVKLVAWNEARATQAPAPAPAGALAKALGRTLYVLEHFPSPGETVSVQGILTAGMALSELREALAAQAPAVAPTATFGALMAKTADCNKLHRALELACSHLTDEQAAEVAAAMPEVALGYALLPTEPGPEWFEAVAVHAKVWPADGLPVHPGVIDAIRRYHRAMLAATSKPQETQP